MFHFRNSFLNRIVEEIYNRIMKNVIYCLCGLLEFRVILVQ